MSPARDPDAPRRCILLLIDGLRADVAESQLAARQLPCLEELTLAGARRRAVTVFPSTTSVAYLPFLTGRRPGACNIPSIRWMDRAAYGGRWWTDRRAIRSYCGYQAGMLDADIDPSIETIFDREPASTAIFSMITRGLHPDRDLRRGARKFWGVVSHYTEWHQPGDDAVAAGLLEAIDSPSRFIFAQFPAVDGYTHAHGPDAPQVLAALRRVDATVGRMTARLRARGELDDTLVLIVSDHGSGHVTRHLDVASWFRSQGVPTLSHPVLWTRSPRAAVMIAGNGMAAVYARPGAPRNERLSLEALRQPGAFGTSTDLVATLIDEPAVALVAGSNDSGGIRVASRVGEADITDSGDVIAYLPRTGDPLQMGGEFIATDRAWLDATIDGPFPDAGPALIDQIASPRSGDLIIAANEGWDFREAWEYPEHHAGHGSLIAAHMLTPAWSNRPLPQHNLRTIDLYDVMTEWLEGSREQPAR